MKRNEKFYENKRIRALIEEYYSIPYGVKYDKYIKLENPIHYGWNLRVVLHENVIDEHNIYEDLIKYGIHSNINRYISNKEARKIHGTRPDFTKNGRKRTYNIEYPQLKWISPIIFNYVIPKDYRKYFKLEEITYFTPNNKVVKKEFYTLDLPDECFVIECKPNYITHKGIIKSDLMSRKDYLNSLLTRKNIPFDYIRSKKYKCDYDRTHYKRNSNKQVIQQELERYNN